MYCLEVPGAEADRAWLVLREAVGQTGHWPVLLGGDEERERAREARDDAHDRAADLIERALAIDVEDWLEGEYRERLEGEGQAPDDPNARLLTPDGFVGLSRGRWPRRAAARPARRR